MLHQLVIPFSCTFLGENAVHMLFFKEGKNLLFTFFLRVLMHTHMK